VIITAITIARIADHRRRDHRPRRAADHRPDRAADERAGDHATRRSCGLHRRRARAERETRKRNPSNLVHPVILPPKNWGRGTTEMRLCCAAGERVYAAEAGYAGSAMPTSSKLNARRRLRAAGS